MTALVLGLCVGLAGAAGSVLRVWLDTLVTRYVPVSAGHDHPWPAGTLAANILGSFAMGLLAGFAEGSGWSPEVQAILSVGLCGGLTTFSTFGVATVRLWQAERHGAAVGNACANVLLGVAAATAGLWLGVR
ncbi:fluoride efflux transporter CrcB [Arthrobacter sp. KK5.5]|uniref:fluoride efflux transporter CrcB n=1 Tax=Arthrobacter sp. KK5.5 TaxID=3373084 RepID=UPI003EE68968